MAVVTPNHYDTMKTCLDRAGGREGTDYMVLARAPVAVRAGV